MFFISRLFAIAVVLGAVGTGMGPQAAAGAEIYISDKQQCAVELKGEIQSGDSAILAALIDQLESVDELFPQGPEGMTNPDEAICLNSQGGDFLEVSAISRLIHDKAIVTRVLADNECYAACAMIFMAGRTRGMEGADGPRRILDVEGRLGFGAPSFTFDASEVFNGEDVNAAVQTMTAFIADFIEFGSISSENSIGSTIPVSLIHQLLRLEPDEVLMADTVERVSRWDIQISGAQETNTLTDEQLVQACHNFQSWTFDRDSRQVENFDFFLPYTTHKRTLYGRAVLMAEIITGDYVKRNCDVEIAPEESSGVNICSNDGFTGALLGDCANGWSMWVPWYYGLSPEASLRSLAP